MRSLLKLRGQKGFTIVELLIVIVVIGILAALVITTFTGIQQRARNTERETDIKAIYGVVEAYYADERGYYPSLDELVAGLPGLEEGALTPPGDNAQMIDANDATTNKYQYLTVPADCDNDATPAVPCTGYTLEAALEGGGAYTKSALN